MKLSRHGIPGSIALLLLALLLTGCSGGSQVLGANSRAEVILESGGIGNLRLTISPEEGGPGDSDACTEADPGSLNCALETPDPFTTLLRFDTNSDASSRPYHVYVSNVGGVTRPFSLDIIMDGDSKLTRSLSIAPGDTLFVARIFRNNAGRP